MPGSQKALILVGAASVVGLALWCFIPGKTSPSFIAIPFIWIGAGWYVWARIAESKSPSFIKLVKITTGEIATMLSPFLLCHSPTAASALTDLMHYGWNSRIFGEAGRVGFSFLGAMIGIFALADVVDLLIRRRGTGTRAVTASGE